ncbi:hypothetical protein BGZ99_009791 [Dissophora globulifera]|uniref:Metallo-beta-lactamase domain-containing protein n=1 Tax=Dissophora globulifera TaxID=979702 RepID=A0A9P6R3Z7_9FUNG|nr:hypothetical protein BGZ99_009791 [Dissophora globulifera]
MIDANANTFPDLVELDALRLTVIVDNEVDFMTSVPKALGLTTQAQRLFTDKRNLDKEKSKGLTAEQAGSEARDTDSKDGAIRTIAFDFGDVCCGAHGLSILVTGIKGDIEHRMLFDTGPQPANFLENAKRLEIEFEKIEVIVLSHWHVDHSGGMMAAVDKIREARHGLSPVVVDLHPDRPDQRGVCLTKPGDGPPELAEYVAWGKDPSFEGLEKAGAKVAKNVLAHTICEGFFGVSGVIPRRTSYETGIPNHARWSDDNKTWSLEPEIMDERYVVARVKSKGIVVLTGCSHAGVTNVCQDAKMAFQQPQLHQYPDRQENNNELFFVVGGFHLAGGSVETRIKETVRDMQEINPLFMAPGHCSGWRAKAALEQAMPGRVISLGVGSDFFIAPEDSSSA